MTVTFKDYDGTVLKVQEVDAGGSAVPPETPYRAKYVFAGWQPSYENIQSDVSCYAQYSEISYKSPRIITEVNRSTTLFAYQ